MNASEKYDLVVVGAGPGGYVACLRAVQLGMKVACVEKDARLGGTCLNVGCIPSKALLDSSEVYHQARSEVAEHGVRVTGVDLDLASMMTRKERVVRELTDSLSALVEGSGVAIYRGTASLGTAHEVAIRTSGSNGEPESSLVLTASWILLATGSEPTAVPGLPYDGERIVSSTEALSFEAVPERLGIVGGGYIGLELGSVWSRLGSHVTVIEMLPMVASTLDRQVGRALERSLARQGLAFRLGSRVLAAEVGEDGVSVTVETGGETSRERFDRLMVAVGRRPLTRGLNLDSIGIRIDPKSGQIPVDETYRTNVPSICAIGDLIAGPMLAHKASAEGIAAVECMVGLPGEVNYDAIPAIVYTSPEVGSVGHAEERLKELGVPYRTGVYPFSGAPRARCLGETEGFVKVLAHARSGRILGVHVIGPRASELIAEATVVLETGLTAAKLARIVHGHPTFSEALHEAASAIAMHA
ncbi:MAG: dihydrolipoyl dehydrogenase [Syntrophobacteraceae bacterium]